MSEDDYWEQGIDPHTGATVKSHALLPLLEGARASLKADHVPRFEHKCQRTGHGWETCGIAASLVDPHDLTVEHGCSKSVEPLITFERAEVREAVA